MELFSCDSIRLFVKKGDAKAYYIFIPRWVYMYCFFYFANTVLMNCSDQLYLITFAILIFLMINQVTHHLNLLVNINKSRKLEINSHEPHDELFSYFSNY